LRANSKSNINAEGLIERLGTFDDLDEVLESAHAPVVVPKTPGSVLGGSRSILKN
jgi:hypothetical protein